MITRINVFHDTQCVLQCIQNEQMDYIRIRKLEQTPSITGFVKKWNSYNRWNSLSRTIDYLVTLHQASTDLPQYEKSRLSSQNKIQGLWII